MAFRNLPSEAGVHVQELGDPIIRRAVFERFDIVNVSLSSTVKTTWPDELGWGTGSKPKAANAAIPKALSKRQLSVLSRPGNCATSAVSAYAIESEKADVAAAWLNYLEANPMQDYTHLVAREVSVKAKVSSRYEGSKKIYSFIEPQRMEASSEYLSGLGEEAEKEFFLEGLIEGRRDQPLLGIVNVKSYGADGYIALPLMGYITRTTDSEATYEPVTGVVKKWVDSDFFDQRLIYNGISGSTVKFLYREYSGDYNRVSFAQEIQYDLEDGREVGFKGSRFEILSASNTNIQYRIIRPFAGDFN